MPNVRTRTGRYVHAATSTWNHFTLFGEKEETNAAVVCDQVPVWHIFTTTTDAVTCPKCLEALKRMGKLAKPGT